MTTATDRDIIYIKGKNPQNRRNLKMNFEQLQNYLDTLPACGIPVSDTAVTLDGKTVFRHSAGYAEAETKRPIRNDDLYFVFSISKITACVAAMRLVEEGKLSLDDPVSKYLPAYAHLTVKDPTHGFVPAKNVMTILHLFTMTGGLNYTLKTPPIMRVQNSSDPSTLRLVNAFVEMPLEFEPGTRYQYSLCHDVLGAVVEIASGMKLSEYLQKNVFDPLGMKDIGFRPSEEQKKRFSAQYNYHNGSNYSTPVPTGNPYAFTPDYDSGGAGLFSTVDEYMKMITVLANGGTTKDGYVLLRPESIEMMGKDLLNDIGRNNFVNRSRYGYGWGLCGRAHVDPTVSFVKSSVGEFGWDGAAGAFCMVDPKKNIALYFGTHLFGFGYGYDRLHWKLLNLAIEAIEE